MSPEDFGFVARLLRRRSGLSLSLSKMAHVERRLEPVVRLFDLKDMPGLVRQLRLGHESLAAAATEALTVNESAFFRDPDFFAAFGDTVLPPLLAARKREKRLRIWSAAAASGQEAYSVAMLLSERGLVAWGWAIDIIATDLSGEAIARAEEGLYAGHELQRGLDPARRAAYFHPEGRGWRVSDKLRRMVRWRKFNLLDSYGWLDDVDVIFCRNVLIYFDRATRLSVLERMGEALAPDGVLLLGKSESAQKPQFAERLPGVYGLRPPQGARLAG